MKKGAIGYLKELKLPDKLFATLFFGFLFSFLPFWLVGVIASLFGAEVTKFNGEYVDGIVAVVTLTLLLPIETLAISAIVWVFLKLGYWVIGLLPEDKNPDN